MGSSLAPVYGLPLKGWRWIRRDSLLTAIVGPLLVVLIVAAAGAGIMLVRSMISGDPSVIEKVGNQEMWTSSPTLFPAAERMLGRTSAISAPSSRFDPYPQVRTAQELANDAFDLAGDPVIVVGRIAAIESLEAPDPKLGRQEISLLGEDRVSRVVMVAGVPIGRFPPPLVAAKPGRFAPIPGSPQRFKPDLNYGVFIGMVAAVGTTTSPDGGPVRTAYVIAAHGSLMSTNHTNLKLGPAVRSALNDL